MNGRDMQMKNGYDMRINRPLVNTYGWLHANVTTLPGVRMGHDVSLTAEVPPAVHEAENPGPVYSGMKTGMGPDMDVLLGYSGASTRVYTVPKDTDGGVLRLHYAFPDENAEYDPTGKSSLAPDPLTSPGASGEHTFPAVGRYPGVSGRGINSGVSGRVGDSSAVTGNMGAVCIELGDNAVLTAVLDYRSPDSASGLAALQTKIILGVNARLKLVQIQRLGTGYAFLHDTGVVCGENARLDLVRLILGGRHTFDGCSAALSGDHSAFHTDIGYRVGGDGRLDMNYEAIHTGKRTECEIHAAGVLREHAFKLFRGTIDLRRGCSGSVGNETEDVLLMDETVRAQTIPVILCGEEDVVGNHGASIGRLDESLIYYLESRGMERDAIYEMCAQAKIDAVVCRIPDPVTIRTLFPWLSGEEDPMPDDIPGETASGDIPGQTASGDIPGQTASGDISGETVPADIPDETEMKS